MFKRSSEYDKIKLYADQNIFFLAFDFQPLSSFL